MTEALHLTSARTFNHDSSRLPSALPQSLAFHFLVSTVPEHEVLDLLLNSNAHWCPFSRANKGW